ncbi:TonB family protein [Variovorax sp. OK605]|uniref:TonB family protein n=1 Tax=Variovorax sp. OK605 TaxID=1855317 RepID=UPI0015A55FC0|nr:TonB family protein [Variovorax sp. OK605]
MLGSVALHAVLLWGVWNRPHVASQSKVKVIEARLLVSPPSRIEAPVSEPSAPLPLPLPESLPQTNASPAPVPPLGEPRAQVQARTAPVEPAPVAVPQQEKEVPAEVPQARAAQPTPPTPVAPDTGVAASASAAVYLPASELDPPPRPLTEIQLAYPTNAGFRSGQVVLDLLIGASGAVEDVKIIEATPVGVFEASAISAFVGTRFVPGMRAGIAVAARMRVAVQYSATGMGATVSGTGAQLQQSAPAR